MKAEEYNESVQRIASLDLSIIEKEIGMARCRMSEVIVQLSSAGGDFLLPQLHDIEDSLEVLKNHTTSVRATLTLSELSKLNDEEARRLAFDMALIDAKGAARRVIEILERAIALTRANAAVNSEKVMNVYTAQDMAAKFVSKLRMVLPATSNNYQHDDRGPDKITKQALDREDTRAADDQEGADK